MLAAADIDPQRRADHMTPGASVVIAAYQTLQFLDEAVDSMLRQTFADFELIVVDDGNPAPDVFERLAARDSRIRILRNERNLGASAAANRGIAAARSDIIVRLDADDIAEPACLERLMAAFAADPGLGMLGSWFLRIDAEGRELELVRTPVTDWELRWRLLFHNPFCHSGMAYRRAVFERAGRYNEAARASLDADLWYRMIDHCRVACLPEVLARARVHPHGITAANRRNWRKRTEPHRQRIWASLGVAYPSDIAADLAQFVGGWDVSRVERRQQVHETVLDVLHCFARQRAATGRHDPVARAVSRDLIARSLAAPADSAAAWLRLCRLAWRIAPAGAAGAAMRRGGTRLRAVAAGIRRRLRNRARGGAR